MRIRRIFALLILASVVLAAASCSTQQSAEPVTSAVQTTETKENLDLFCFELSDEEMARINALDRNEKHDWY